MKCINIWVVLLVVVSVTIGKDWWWNNSTDSLFPNVDQSIRCKDGSIVTYGSAHNGLKRYWGLTKISQNNDTIWKTEYNEKPIQYVGCQLVESNDRALFLVNQDYDKSDPIALTVTHVYKFDSRGSLVWDRVYGEDSCDYLLPFFFEGNSGRQYLLSGREYRNTDIEDVIVTTIDDDGEIIWSKAIEGTAFGFHELYEHTDGSLYLLQNENYGLYFSKLDSSGNLLWRKIFKGEGKHIRLFERYRILELSDGSMLFCGVWKEGAWNTTNTDVWVFRVSRDGELILRKRLGGPKDEFPTKLYLNSDQTISMVGRVLSNDTSEYDVWFSMIDINGAVIWSKTLATSGSDLPCQLFEDADSCFLLWAESKNKSWDEKGWLIKLSQTGNVLWDKFFPLTNSDHFNVLKSENGNHCLIGSFRGSVTKNIYSIQSLPPTQFCSPTSPLSFHVGVETADSINYGYSLLEAPEGMAVSKGGTVSWTPTTDSVYMEHVRFLRVDDKGTQDTLWFDVWANREEPIIPVIEPDKNKEIVSQNQISVTSNSNALTINSNHNIQKVELFDLQGRLLKSQSLSSVMDNVSISTTNFATGLYIVKVNAGDHQFYKTVVLR